MTDASSNLPIPVDYTSRDFYALRNDLITRVKSNIPSWTGTDPTDFGMAIIEAFSYMGDIANYYIDRLANEAYINTATQRSTLLSFARSFGYSVAGYRSASTTLAFGNSKSTSLTLPINTVVYVDISVNDTIRRVYYTLTSAVTIPGNTALSTSGTYSSYTASAVQGIALANATGTTLDATNNVYGALLASATGQANQSFRLSDTNIVDGSLKVYLYNGSSYVLWTEVNDFTIYGKSDRVYTTFIDENNYKYIQFGNGVSGAIPSNSSQIYVAYNKGDGVYGNLAAYSIPSNFSPISYVPNDTASNYTPYVTFTNTTPAVGGVDPESNSSIRATSAGTASSLGKAVTLADYQTIAYTVPNAGKVNAVASSWTSVSLFVAPKRNSLDLTINNTSLADYYPGYTGDPTSTGTLTVEMNQLVSDVQSYVANYSQIGVTVTVSPVTYTPIYIQYNYTPVTGYTATDVQNSINTYLLSKYSYANAKPGTTITKDNLSRDIMAVAGVSTASITTFAKKPNGILGSDSTSLTGNSGEIFVLTSANLVPSNTSAMYLSGLTFTTNTGSVTVTPSFSSTTLSYTVTVYTGSNTFNVAATWNTGTYPNIASVTVGGYALTSGTAINLGNLSTGVTATTVVLNGTNGARTTYNITISKTAAS